MYKKLGLRVPVRKDLNPLGMRNQVREFVYNDVDHESNLTYAGSVAYDTAMVLVPLTKLPKSPKTITSFDELPKWKQNIIEGNQFNRDRRASYPYNEVYIERSGKNHVRLDSYNPDLGEIVSRKYTQSNQIKLNTAKSYIREIPKSIQLVLR
ncbi:hypothetical protein [Poriferisphaera corsica]|nr:hypothetical protein [Poriferisphaera corsica]